ncbi:MAG TPA: hypothetical protein VF342_12025 [Alphaproteobacteria bacterium]
MARDVIFEFYRVGNAIKVSAVDPVTTVEVSIVGPATWDEAALKRVATRKLEFVLAQRQSKIGKPGR